MAENDKEQEKPDKIPPDEEPFDGPPGEPFDVSGKTDDELDIADLEDSPSATKTTGTILGILGIVIILAIITAFTVPSILNSRRHAQQSVVISQLKTIGNAQIAYQSTNTSRIFGTFNALKANEYVPEDATLTDMIDSYSLYWRAWESNLGSTSVFHENTRFTVIAYPVDLSLDNLSTFGIMHDQVVRVYNPDNENNPNSVHTWDPVL